MATRVRIGAFNLENLHDASEARPSLAQRIELLRPQLLCMADQIPDELRDPDTPQDVEISLSPREPVTDPPIGASAQLTEPQLHHL